jgi:hypothetical protein
MRHLLHVSATQGLRIQVFTSGGRLQHEGGTLKGVLIAILLLGVIGFTVSVLYGLRQRRVESARRVLEEYEAATSPSPAPLLPSRTSSLPKVVRPSSPAAVASPPKASQASEEPPEDERRRERFPVTYTSLKPDAPEVVEARALLENYLKVVSWPERLPFAYQQERAEDRMRDFYEKRGQSEPVPGRFLGAGTLSAGESKMLNLRFACASRPDYGLRANFHRGTGGKLLLDWESWVTWSEMPWDELKKERPQKQTLLRAIASESSYYNFEFSENWRWLAVKLRSPDGLHSLTGYVRRDTHLGIAVANLIGVPLPHKFPEETPLPALARSGSKALVTVRVVYPDDCRTDHCVRIVDLMADRWVLFPGEER